MLSRLPLRSLFLLALLALTVAGCSQRTPPASTPPAPGPSDEASDTRGPSEETEATSQDPAQDPGQDPAGIPTEPAEEWLPLPGPDGRYTEEQLAGPEDPAPGEELTESPHDELDKPAPEISAEEAEAEMALVADSEPTFDVPIEVNDRVLAYIELYSKRIPSRWVHGLKRSGRYMEMFREIFAEEGVPQDLVYFAHVESAYKTSAYSRARAKGVFQFIAATGKRYGLRVDYWVDERSDPEKACRASARYLKDLYDEFGDWYLALAGYNAGEGKIRRAIRKTGKKDFWAIAKTRYIRRETKNYVPAILATILISKDPQKYGFDFEYDDEITYETVQVEGAADFRVLAESAGTDVATIKLLNPALRRQQTPPLVTSDVRVPVGTGQKMLVALAEIPKDKRVTFQRHYVRQGESLSTIARAYGVSVYSIQQANGMGRRTMIRAGKTLKIPSASGPALPAVAGADGTVTYRVRRGDSLSRIASRFGTSSRSIANQNRMSIHDVLSVGQKLTFVPGPGYVARSKPKAQPRTPIPAGQSVTHRVVGGDTLWDLAKRYGTTAGAIARANGISTRATLKLGQKLTVPSGNGGASTSQTAVARNSAAPAAAATASTAAAASQGTVGYTVRNGDNLWVIAKQFNTTPAAIAEASGISTRKTLRIGDRLKVVPGARNRAAARKAMADAPVDGPLTHRVRRGDTLWEIASKYRTSIDNLCSLNGINRNATLRPGTRLTVRR